MVFILQQSPVSIDVTWIYFKIVTFKHFYQLHAHYRSTVSYAIWTSWKAIMDHLTLRVSLSWCTLSNIHMPSMGSCCGADSRFAPSQWQTSLQSNAISHWLACKPRIIPDAVQKNACKPNCQSLPSARMHVLAKRLLSCLPFTLKP